MDSGVLPKLGWPWQSQREPWKVGSAGTSLPENQDRGFSLQLNPWPRSRHLPTGKRQPGDGLAWLWGGKEEVTSEDRFKGILGHRQLW